MIEWTTWHNRHERKIELVPGIDCWIWIAGTGAGGYGRVSLGGRPEMAHRAAYMAANGSIPTGMLVRHMCGNRMCVRPGHLKVGTKADNARDTAEMFMTVSNLDKEAVRSIRRDYDNGLPLLEIAEKHGIAFGSVYPIVCYKSFDWIDPDKRGQHKLRAPRRLNKAIASEIKKLIRMGEMSQRQIANIYNVRESLISRIKTGDRWPDA